MGRYIGLDYGSKTVGVAVSDPLKTFASPHSTIFREREGKIRDTLRQIAVLCREMEAEMVVVGLPLNMDGTTGERARKSLEFAENLRHRLCAEGITVPVEMCDERLTTVEASEILTESGIKKSSMKEYVDSVAASIILGEYMKQTENRKG